MRCGQRSKTRNSRAEEQPPGNGGGKHTASCTGQSNRLLCMHSARPLREASTTLSLSLQSKGNGCSTNEMPPPWIGARGGATGGQLSTRLKFIRNKKHDRTNLISLTRGRSVSTHTLKSEPSCFENTRHGTGTLNNTEQDEILRVPR